MNIEENISLASHTTLGVGGRARYYVEVKNKDELAKAVEWAKNNSLPVFILGGGSNLLISDDGISGLVIKNLIMGREISSAGTFIEINAGAGENWHQLVEFAVANGLGGIESLAGIPGTVGAAPVQNINAYGQGVDRVIKEVEVYDLLEGGFKILPKSACRFDYRTSIFKKEERGRYIVSSVVFRLEKGAKSEITYHNLLDYFKGRTPSLDEVKNAVLRIRSKKGMVILSGRDFLKSAGSFFINPAVEKKAAAKIKFRAALCNSGDSSCCSEPWYWEQPGGKVKVSAACLLHMAGFKPGTRLGEVGISPRHALAIVNHGGAKALEIKEFADAIRLKIENEFGISLEAEPEFVGF
ncbi:UDP-N-acetylmuramate dehydrogenase [Candidatus Giovannonibacteria bacterium]|nr:UDP-N-acetylmuramate dehydrogenase [Candidatus Giovannonibacteria bacterium]